MPTDITTNVPGNKPAPSHATKSRDPKSTNQKKIQIIMEFLKGCSPYESDALRAMLAVATGNSSADAMPQYDRTAINRYLNYGWDKETDGADGIREHRQTRALQLMKTVSEYVGKEDIINITSVLLSISSDRKDVETALINLPKIKTGSVPNTTSNTPGNIVTSK